MKKLLVTYGALALLIIPPVVFADEATDATTTPETATSSEEVIVPPTVPVPDPVAITLDVEISSGTLFNGPLTVSACSIFPGSATSTVSGFCALEQSGLTNTWSWYGDDAFLGSVNGTANDYGTGAYWTWFSDLDLGAVALNKHELTGGEKLLITIGNMPLRISVSNASSAVGATTSVTVLQFAFDADFNAVWLPAASSTVHVGSSALTSDASGMVEFAATSTDSLDVYATKEYFLPSSHITLTPSPTPVTPDLDSAPEETPIGNGPIASGGGGGISVSQPVGDSASAITFLSKKQNGDGSFGNSFLSDWVAIALSGTPSAVPDALRSYLTQEKQLTSTTDYERRAMALEALGIDPSTGFNPIEKIVGAFDGTQIGDPNQVNDDIFALFPLLHAGYTSSDDIINKEVTFILSHQEADGSWDSVDLTSAAIQALAPLSNSSTSGVSQALQKARDYLASREHSDGCFGNVYSTSWALQAISALGETPQQWTTISGATPLSCLAVFQQIDGGFEPANSANENRIWATAYAIPALEGKSWNSILQTFSRRTSVIPTTTMVSIATTTILSATSSLATTTPQTLPLLIATSSSNDVLSSSEPSPDIARTQQQTKPVHQRLSPVPPLTTSTTTQQVAAVADAAPNFTQAVARYIFSGFSRLLLLLRL